MKRVLLLMIVMTLAAGIPVFAQGNAFTDDEQAAMDAVSGAMDAVLAADSYHVNTEQYISQQIEVSVGKETFNLDNGISQTSYFQMIKTAAGYDSVGTIDQIINTEVSGEATNISLSLKMVMLDNNIYLRVIGDAGELASMLPQGWVNLSEDSSARSNPFFSSFDPDAITQLSSLRIPFDETTITGIEVLDRAEIDGQTMDVFQVEFDPQTFIDSGVLGTLGQSITSQFTAEETEQLLEDMFRDAQLGYTMYIGQDGLLHQLDSALVIDTTLEIQGFSVPLVMTMNSSAFFSRFNEPVTIKEPVVGT
jgi:hypothetical protein